MLQIKYITERGVCQVTRFKKYVTLVAVLAITAAATAGAVIHSYYWRGRFAFGGEWLIPAVVAAVWEIVREVKRIFKITEEKENGEIH